MFSSSWGRLTENDWEAEHKNGILAFKIIPTKKTLKYNNAKSIFEHKYAPKNYQVATLTTAHQSKRLKR